jgi:putative flippase GtrA
LVGGSAFLIDAGILFLLQTYLLYRFGEIGILISTAVGFIAGLIYNFILSTLYVFKRTNENAKKHPVRSFVIFTIIGIVGLILTEAGMYAGIRLLGVDHYMFVKVVVAGIVLIWNYTARKILIFKGKTQGETL